jgi:hypothetical protein
MTNAKLTERLAELRKESQEGGKIKQELTQKLANIDITLLRISGAIQVLEELNPEDKADAATTPASDSD